jgi:DNA polymerase-3 subunit epsilon
VRQVVIDTETTGLDPTLGHRIIEIAAVEIIDRRLTGNHFHRYVDPERDSEEAALQIHGLTREFLNDKPKFRDVVKDFVEFVQGAELVIHNAGFDIAFIDWELALLSMQPVASCCAAIVDTLKIAREMHPGKRNALDSLCDRYQIDHSARTLHGALLDAQLLAEVYLAMTRGQESLLIDQEMLQISIAPVHAARRTRAAVVLLASSEELQSHERALLDIAGAIGSAPLWQRLSERAPPVSASA